jgi:hypothetical protein
MRVAIPVQRGPAGVRVGAAVLAVGVALAVACWREGDPSGPSGPLAVDRVLGRYSEREGPAGRTVTFDGASGTTFTMRATGGRVFTARGRYWMVGDTVKADYEFGERGGRFAFWALLRGDSLIVVGPLRGTGLLPEFPPLVRDRPDQ